MDNWKKYMADNEDKLSIEGVEEKVWQRVSRSVIPKRGGFQKCKAAFQSLLAVNDSRRGNTARSRNGKVKLAFAFVLAALVIFSFTLQVKGYAKYGDLVSFTLARQHYLLNYEKHSASWLHSFSRMIHPSDSASFLFLKCVKNNSEAPGMIDSLKRAEGVSGLMITPVMFEFRQSLFSSFLHKAFEIQTGKPRPQPAQIRNEVNALLKAKGLGSLDVHIDPRSEEVWIDPGPDAKSGQAPSIGDSVIGTNSNRPEKAISKGDTTVKLKPGLATPEKGADTTEPRGYNMKKDLQLMSDLTKALEKDGLVDNRNEYKLEIKNGEFYIDDRKQPKEVTERYRKYFRDDNYTIINNADKVKSRSDQ